MNPIWGHLIGVGIVLMMLCFIGVWIWAWLPHHRPAFNTLARIPMNDERTADESSQDTAP